jgi:hypothetical protein
VIGGVVVSVGAGVAVTLALGSRGQPSNDRIETAHQVLARIARC